MTNTFKAADWDEHDYAEIEGGTKLAHAKMTYIYTGQLEGQGLVNAVLTYLPDGTGTYVGSELFTGTVNGKQGTVAFQHTGTFDAVGIVSAWAVAPGSGTGDLADAKGEGAMEMKMGTESAAYTFTEV